MNKKLKLKIFNIMLGIVNELNIPILNGIIYNVNDKNEYIRLNFGSDNNYKFLKKLKQYGIDLGKENELICNGIYGIVD